MKEAIAIAATMRQFFPTYLDVMSRSIGAQLSYANTIHASFAVLVGKTEVEDGKVTLRNLASGEQEKLSLDECVERLKTVFAVGNWDKAIRGRVRHIIEWTRDFNRFLCGGIRIGLYSGFFSVYNV